MKIAVGTDHAGYRTKEAVKEYLKKRGHKVVDFGADTEEPSDYPRFIRPVAESVARGECHRGVVFGGSGNGEAMVANRVRGVRCALCWNAETASLARRHNDANVLSIGARMVDQDQALEIVRIWLETPFEGGRHARRIEQIDEPDAMGNEAPSGRATFRKAAIPEKKAEVEEGPEVLISFRSIRYREKTHTLELTVEPGLKHGTIVHVPSETAWNEVMPAWARDRREEILRHIRLKSAHLNCEWKEI